MTIVPSNLRSAISDEVHELMGYHRAKSALVTMSPATLTLLDCKLPTTMIPITVMLDDSLKSGYFRTEKR